jgi:hypothetical protein
MTNNPLYTVLATARDLGVQELVVGASNKFTADEQLEQIAFYWINLHSGQPTPLTVRIMSRDRDLIFDLHGGHRIPKISERQARSVAELRAAGVGVDRVLLVHDGSQAASDLFRSVLTMLDPEVALALVRIGNADAPANGSSLVQQDQEQARKLDRDLQVYALGNEEPGPGIVRLAREGQYDLIVLGLPTESPTDPLGQLTPQAVYLVRHAHCPVFLATQPAIPQEVVDTTQKPPA